MNERLSDDKFKSIFKPERVKIASLDSPPNSMIEILALSEEFEKLRLTKFASVMLKVAEGMDDPSFQEPEVTDVVEDDALSQEPEQPPAGQKPRDWMACNTCKFSHRYDLYNDDTIGPKDWIRVDNHFNVYHKGCFNKILKTVENLLKGTSFTVESLTTILKDHPNILSLILMNSKDGLMLCH